jgi:hypothetical protein
LVWPMAEAPDMMTSATTLATLTRLTRAAEDAAANDSARMARLPV